MFEIFILVDCSVKSPENEACSENRSLLHSKHFTMSYEFIFCSKQEITSTHECIICIYCIFSPCLQLNEQNHHKQ